MRLVIAPVVTIVRRTSMPAVSSYDVPLRRRMASTSYIQFSSSKRAKFSARRRSTRRDSRETPADHADRSRVEIGPRCRPLLDDPVDGVLVVGDHAPDGRPRRLVTPATCRDG
jgi:hypothetical protein